MAATATGAGSHPGPGLRIACVAAVFIASLGLYLRTLAPTVTLVDSGELIVAARTLGVAHPPGFPLYVLLAHLATLVPISSVAVRVNFASALFAALAASAMAVAVLEAMSFKPVPIIANRAARKKERDKKGKKSAPAPQPPDDFAVQSSLSLVAACLVSGLLLAFSRTLWAYATIAEVYTLNALLILIIFLLMFRWRRKVVEARAQRSSPATGLEESKAVERLEGGFPGNDPSSPRPIATSSSYGSLYAAAFVFGLALGVHHVTVGLMLPALAVFVLATEGFRFFKSKRLLYAALFAFAGLSIYAYLPIAASRSPLMNWGDPRTLERFWWHVTGRQYQVFFSPSLETMVRQFADFIKIAAREFGPWWLPAVPVLAITGFIQLFRRDKALSWFLVLVIFADLTYSLGYEIAEDKDAYYLPTFIATAIAAGFGAAWLIKASSQKFSSANVRYIAAALVLLVPATALVGNFSYNNRSRYFIAEDYAVNILSTMEPGAMLLTRDWQVYSPMLYVHELERRREDAVIIDINQLRRSWYFDYLARAYPSTIEQVRDEVDAFLEDLRHWEQDPDLYQRDLSLNQRINTRFYEMILAFVANHIRSAPVYVTLDIAANRDAGDSDLTKSLAGLYQFVPQGLIFQLATAREFQQPSDPQLETRGLTDGAISFEDDDVVRVKVLPVYVTMFYNRGRYLAAYGRHEQAIESYKRALVLQPAFTAAQRAMDESLNALRKQTAGPQ